MKRILTAVLLFASFFIFQFGNKPKSGITPTVATVSSTADCDDKELICGTPFRDSDGTWYQWCHCPGNGLWIRRPAF